MISRVYIHLPVPPSNSTGARWASYHCHLAFERQQLVLPTKSISFFLDASQRKNQNLSQTGRQVFLWVAWLTRKKSLCAWRGTSRQKHPRDRRVTEVQAKFNQEQHRERKKVKLNMFSQLLSTTRNVRSSRPCFHYPTEWPVVSQLTIHYTNRTVHT